MVIHAKVFILEEQFRNEYQKEKVYLNNLRRIRLFVMDFNSFVEFVVFDPLRLHEPKISRNAHLKDINCSHYNIIELRKKKSVHQIGFSLKKISYKNIHPFSRAYKVSEIFHREDIWWRKPQNRKFSWLSTDDEPYKNTILAMIHTRFDDFELQKR